MTKRGRKCLFLMEDHPISPHAPGGGPVTMYSRLELLAHSGVEIHLAILSDGARPQGFEDYLERQPEVWQRVQGWCKSFTQLSSDPSASSPGYPDGPLRRLGARVRRHLSLLRDPAPHIFPIAAENSGVRAGLSRLAAEVKPDVVWAENLVAAVVAREATPGIPMVYGFHDWVARLMGLRESTQGISTWRSRYGLWLLDRIERSLIREAAGCVSACANELKEVGRISTKPTAYFPTTYAPILFSNGKAPAHPPRIVHVGGMETVANRGGLERFFEVVWPVVREQTSLPPELCLIGGMTGASELLLERMRVAGVKPLGYVQDLSTVLRPYDLHIIPWEYETGARTRIPMILNHGQVLVSTRAAAVSQPEITNGKDCVLVDDLEEMTRAIVALLPDGPRRKEIGTAGRETFLKRFTREAIQPDFDRFLDVLSEHTAT